MYLDYHSVDVWANQHLFILDSNTMKPTVVSGIISIFQKELHISNQPRRVNPTFFIKYRSNPTEFLSDSLQSESDEIRVESGRISIMFRRIPTKTLSDPIEIFSIRGDPIPPQSHEHHQIPTKK
jgi:hypothetical protein